MNLVPTGYICDAFTYYPLSFTQAFENITSQYLKNLARLLQYNFSITLGLLLVHFWYHQWSHFWYLFWYHFLFIQLLIPFFVTLLKNILIPLLISFLVPKQYHFGYLSDTTLVLFLVPLYATLIPHCDISFRINFKHCF